MLCCNVTYGYTDIILSGHGLPAIKIDARGTKSSEVEVCQIVEKALKFHETRRISCRPGVNGSIVRIASTDHKPRGLSLCEVQVYAVRGKFKSYISHVY